MRCFALVVFHSLLYECVLCSYLVRDCQSLFKVSKKPWKSNSLKEAFWELKEDIPSSCIHSRAKMHACSHTWLIRGQNSFELIHDIGIKSFFPRIKTFEPIHNPLCTWGLAWTHKHPLQQAELHWTIGFYLGNYNTLRRSWNGKIPPVLKFKRRNTRIK